MLDCIIHRGSNEFNVRLTEYDQEIPQSHTVAADQTSLR